MIATLIILSIAAVAMLHLSNIAEQAQKERDEFFQQYENLKTAYDELADAYRDALESCKHTEEDPKDPEYC